jgi:hypothetical protein
MLQAWALTLAKSREIIGMFLERTRGLASGTDGAGAGGGMLASAGRRGGEA